MSITKVLDSLHKFAVEEPQKVVPTSRQHTAKQQFNEWRNARKYGNIPKDENVKKSVEYCKKVVSLIGESTRTFEKDLQDLEKQYKNHLHNVACKRDIKLACEKYLSSCRLATSEYSLDPDAKDTNRPRTVDQQCMAKFRKAITYNTFTNTDTDISSEISLNIPRSELCTKTPKKAPANKLIEIKKKTKNASSKNLECKVLKSADNKDKDNKCKIPISIKITKKSADEDSTEHNKTPCSKPSKQEQPCGSEDKCPKPCSKERTTCEIPRSPCNKKDKCKKTLHADKELTQKRTIAKSSTKVAQSEQCIVENQNKNESSDVIRQTRLNRVLQDYFGQDYKDTEYFKHHGYSFHDMFIHLEKYKTEPTPKPSEQNVDAS